jgi:hypothetical protein
LGREIELSRRLRKAAESWNWRCGEISKLGAIPQNGEENPSKRQIKRRSSQRICTSCAAVSRTAASSDSTRTERQTARREVKGKERGEGEGGEEPKRREMEWRSTEDDEWVKGRPKQEKGKRGGERRRDP